jgi:hypothetical protein
MADTQKEKLSTQAVEAIGRGHLIGKLIREGIGVSAPLWDDGIDLIVHRSDANSFEAVPLQLKVSTNTYVGIEHKYLKVATLKFAFIWIGEADQLRSIFVMSYADLLDLFSKHSKTKSWETGFSTSRASKEKLDQMKRFEVSGENTLRRLIFER